MRNQGQCASGWAFSAAGSLEAQVYKLTGELPLLSEQNMIDCVRGGGGWNGGWMGYAFSYISQTRGIEYETNYPYEGIVSLKLFSNYLLILNGF